MIEPAVANALGRIATRERDVLGAYRAGFTPEASDVARPAQVLTNHAPLSVALPASSYVLTPDAAGNLTYSRDGSFNVSGGELRASDGRPVLGFAVGSRSALAPLRVDPYDAALGHVSGERVEADGTFMYERVSIDPRSGERRDERVVVGRIALARFPAGTQPDRIDALHVRPPAGVAARLGVPADGLFPALATQSRDAGNVDLIAGLERLQEAYTAYEALRAAHHVHGSTDKTAMDLVK